MDENVPRGVSQNQVRFVKIFQTVALFVVVICFAVVILLREKGLADTMSMAGSSSLLYIEIALSIVAVLSLLWGTLFPRIVGWHRKSADTIVRYIATGQLLRISFFESVGIFGLILGILGGHLYLITAMCLLAVIALVLTYPTEGWWNKWKEICRFNPDSTGYGRNV